MLDIGTILRHYKRQDIQEEMVLHAKDREIAVKFGENGFGKRPDILSYPRDILELAKQGATSFHASEELWSNPRQLDPMLKKQELDALRIGWDLVIDIDSQYFPYSKLAADLVVKALKHHDIESITIKFSGNKGFHIGVPFEAFPSSISGQETSKRFPEDTRWIALYLKKMIEPTFLKEVGEMEKRDVEKIAFNLKKKKEDILNGNHVDMLKILDIDTILISGRHLYRMPYSLHEKSGLCSIPIDPNKIMEFQKEQAGPNNVIINKTLRFLDKSNIKPNQAKSLFDKVIADKIILETRKEFEKKELKEVDIPETAIPEPLFPPCIHKILNGLTDGKKRALFVLANFLTSAGWSYEKIEERLKEWNKKNSEPLREVLIVGQLRYHKQLKKKVLPPNCINQMYYKDFAVCFPDNLCSKIKNPINYAKRKAYYLNNSPKKEEAKIEKT